MQVVERCTALSVLALVEFKLLSLQVHAPVHFNLSYFQSFICFTVPTTLGEIQQLASAAAIPTDSRLHHLLVPCPDSYLLMVRLG